ncbi:hypothetical protein EXU57_10395 [Segetibacter sp. 3557_3]|uniref:hypothetical protein n=1 Tax=Segetibacter sp. 3557_3 TaxID=2547429 RepID=UPI001058482A|nr:hypothetical protein [Segetibacter sp. 3557_3]TDH26492.1 hypothetical protein EXU57_10395 [Segetibacter sp. 3557_3]
MSTILVMLYNAFADADGFVCLSLLTKIKTADQWQIFNSSFFAINVFMALSLLWRVEFRQTGNYPKCAVSEFRGIGLITIAFLILGSLILTLFRSVLLFMPGAAFSRKDMQTAHCPIDLNVNASTMNLCSTINVVHHMRYPVSNLAFA